MRRTVVAIILALCLVLTSPAVSAAPDIITVVDRTGDGVWDNNTWQVDICPGETKSTTLTLYNSSDSSLSVEVSIFPDSLDDGNLIFELDKATFTMPGGSYVDVTLTVSASGSATPGTYTTEWELEVLTPAVFEKTFTGTLPKRDMRSGVLHTIPGGATNLEITLEATDDIDLELYDSNVFVVGWGAMIDSQGTIIGVYKGDVFSYSGWDGPDEYITSTGPLSRPYDLKVFAYEAGSYTATVSYVMPAPDVTPPAITIDVADVSLGAPVTIEVSANDLSGVKLIYFGVWPVEYPEEWDSGDPVAMMCTFADEASVTFVPGWADSYTVKAWAVDNVDNSTPEDAPVEVTFIVVS